MTETGSGETVASAPRRTQEKTAPVFIKEREKVLLVSGLHLTEFGISSVILTMAKLSLREHGFEPEMHKMHWRNGVPYGEKEEELKVHIGKAQAKFLVGISAGATPSILLHSEGRVEKIVTLAGWCQKETPENTKYLEPLIADSIAFKEAVEKLGTIKPLTPDQLNRILNIWTKNDKIVPLGTTSIPGARQEEVPWGSHHTAIAASILFRAGRIASHFSN